jgi:hypothetical protein
VHGTLEAVGGLRGRLVPADADTNSGGGEQGTQAQMYSYNGMVLPELPEWDKTTMPYVVMYKDTWERIYVFYTKYANKQASPSTSVSGTYNVRVGEPYKEYRCEDGNWWIYADHSDAIDVEFSHSINIETRVIWTNFDIYTPDGDLIFAASDPIPVYE